MSGISSARPLLWIVYPALVFYGLEYLEPRVFGGLLLALVLLRKRNDAHKLLRGLGHLDHAILAFLLLLIAGVMIANSETLLRLYPAAVNAGLLALFGLSLYRAPPMIERFARLKHPDLPPAGVRYTRRVTQIWCVFFAANGALAAYTALFASREAWALYNGLIAYLLIGVLMGGEWLFRRFFTHHHSA